MLEHEESRGWDRDYKERVLSGLSSIINNQSKQTRLLREILSGLQLSNQAAGFTAVLTTDSQGEKDMVLTGRKASQPAPSMSINPDGTATITLDFTDANGQPITGLAALPAGVATPAFASSDQTPGPSAFTITPAANNLTAVVAVVQPPVKPLAQDVDFNVTIASGLLGQTAPITEDAGTLSIATSSSTPSGFTAVLSEP